MYRNFGLAWTIREQAQSRDGLWNYHWKILGLHLAVTFSIISILSLPTKSQEPTNYVDTIWGRVVYSNVPCYPHTTKIFHTIFFRKFKIDFFSIRILKIHKESNCLSAKGPLISLFFRSFQIFFSVASIINGSCVLVAAPLFGWQSTVFSIYHTVLTQNRC